MKKVLVLYYSQTGQLKQILDSILEPLAKQSTLQIIYEEIKPKKPYPFPWTAYQFCDVFPESVAGIPCELQPLTCDTNGAYDLVILAYTVWYLSPSIPISSFLQSGDADRIFKNRPVVTIIGCRNMWILAQERVKSNLRTLDAKLLGNVVLGDRANNLVGVLTIAVWMLTGKKSRFLGVFPRPGISSDDIREAVRFGYIIREALTHDEIGLNQARLNAADAVNIDPALMIMEKRIAKVFKIWSAFIRQKGGAGERRRRLRVRLFMLYLIVAVVVLAPLASLAAALLRLIRKDQLAAEVAYFAQDTKGQAPVGD